MADSDRTDPQGISGLLIVDFRAVNSSKGYLTGISFSFSPGGVNLEYQNIDFNVGDVMDLVLKDPEHNVSVPVTGQIVWKKEGWYKCSAGVAFSETDRKTRDGINDLMKKIKKGTREISGGKKYETENKEVSAERHRVITYSKTIGKALFKESLKDDAKHADITGSARISDREYLAYAVESLNDSDMSEKKNIRVKTDSGVNAGQEVEKRKARSWVFPALLLAAVLLAALLFNYTEVGEKVTEYMNNSGLTSPAYVERKENASPGNDGIFETGPVPVSVENGSGTGYPVVTGDDGPAYLGAVGVRENTEHSDTLDSNHGTEGAEHEDISRDKAIADEDYSKYNITFAMDSYVVDPDFYPVIDEVSGLLFQNPELMVRIAGHTDDIGPKIYNIDLSMRRALAVKTLFNRRGIEDRRIILEIFGDSKPRTSNNSVSGRVKNRRVEIATVHAGVE